MAALGIALVGAGIGGVFGGVTGALIGYSIGSMVGSLLFPPDLGTVEGPRLQDLQIQSSAEGAPIAQAYGTVRLAGNIIWGKPLQEHRHEEEVGGKGGGGGGESVSYTYTADFAIALCEGPITAIRKLWADGKLIMDLSEPTAEEQAIVDAGGFLDNIVQRQQAFFGETMAVGRTGGTIRIYKGNETQLPDPLIEADLGAGQTPAYRGVAYIVFDNFELADYGNRIPNITAEVVVSGSTAIHYLGKQGPFEPLTMPSPLYPDDAKVEIYSHYVRPDRALAVLGWGHSYATTNHVTGDPLFLYPSGNIQYGQRHSFAGDPTYLVPSYCDEPAYFSYTSGGFNALYLYTLSGGLTGQLIGQFVGPVSNDLNNLDDIPRISGVWYVNGEVWVYNAQLDRVLSAIPPGVVLADDAYATMTFRGGLLGFLSGAALRSVWIGAEEVYVVSGASNPYTLTVVDRDSWVVSRTISLPIPATTAGGIQPAIRMYSSQTGIIYFFYTDTSGTERIYLIDGAQGREIGEVQNTLRDVSNSHNFAIHDDILAVFYGNEIPVPAGGDTTPLIGEIRYWVLNAISTNAVPLSTIVADVCNRAGLESNYINVTDLASVDVRGYLRSSQMAGRQAIEPLARAYQFDAVETDGVLKFIQRGSASVLTVDADDLGAGQEPTERHITTITQDTELPIEVDIQYMDIDRDYQVGAQRSRRLVPNSQRISSVSLPVVLTGTEAKQTAEILHYLSWADRTAYKFSLPMKHLALDPGDAITVPINGANRRVRLTRTSLGAAVDCEAVADDLTIYTSDAAAAATTSAKQTLTAVGHTIPSLLDIPILRDLDDDAGFYAAAAGTGDGWHGAALFRSTDQLEWARISAITTGSTLGTCQTALASGPTTIVDDGSTVDVRLLAGSLTSVTETQMFSGSNTCAIGNQTNGWEVLSFQNATLQADGSYRLSRLLRGRRGTEWAVGQHVVGDMFVLLESGKLVRPVPSTTDINADRYYRAVSFGGTLQDADILTYRHQAVGKKPYAVTHITGRRHYPSTNDWTISWVRRGRIDAEWRDYVGVPLGEASESYEIDIMSGSTVVRTLTATSQSTTYTAAQQTTDFGSTQSSIDVRIYQMSDTVGRGYVATATL